MNEEKNRGDSNCVKVHDTKHMTERRNSDVAEENNETVGKILLNAELLQREAVSEISISNHFIRFQHASCKLKCEITFFCVRLIGETL